MSLCFVLVGYQGILSVFFGVTSIVLEKTHNYDNLRHSDATLENMNKNIIWFIKAESQLNAANQIWASQIIYTVSLIVTGVWYAWEISSTMNVKFKAVFHPVLYTRPKVCTTKLSGVYNNTQRSSKLGNSRDYVNTFKPRRNWQHFADNIFNVFSSMKMFEFR